GRSERASIDRRRPAIPSAPRGRRVDLALFAHEVSVWPRPVRVGESVRLRVPVHNLSGVASEDFALVLRIPRWNIQAQQHLNLAARETAEVEFTLHIPTSAALVDAHVEIQLDPENRIAERRRANNRLLLRQLFTEALSAGPRDRAVLEFEAGGCVGLRLDSGQLGDCDGLNDLELHSDTSGSIRLVAEGIGPLGPAVLNRPVGVLIGLSTQVPLEAGNAYAVVRGDFRARVRVVRMELVGSLAVRPRHGLPRPLKVPSVNDPFKLPKSLTKRDAPALKPRLIVELEWQRLSP
ncbi:MAG: CARDB domain-containing protein, partial [Terriglobia bacterium]